MTIVDEITASMNINTFTSLHSPKKGDKSEPVVEGRQVCVVMPGRQEIYIALKGRQVCTDLPGRSGKGDESWPKKKKIRKM